jgi:hypothetical protein
MIQIEEAIIRKLIFHRITLENSIQNLSNSLFETENDEQDDTLKKIFLKPFITNTTTFEFKHEIDLNLNTLFTLSKSIFEDNEFIPLSRNICQHLKSVSKHPLIKDGDLFIIKYSDIKLNNKYYEGLGIYKIENKDSFIETSANENGNISLNFKKGIGNKRLDKACLILFSEEPYTIFLIDKVNTETDYWQNEFVKVGFKNDNINNTNQFLSLTKSFVTQELPKGFEVTRADQIDLLNRSVEYFKTHDIFEKEEFEENVLNDKGIIQSFRSFDTQHNEDNEIEMATSFEISQQAVKKQAKALKSVLKLDKNFHIYIHGDKEMIEQGIDPNGRKYYKIFYETES